MSEETFDLGDLYGLEVCLQDLDEMLARSQEAAKDKAIRYALVKTFELTYELAVKTIRKYLIAKNDKKDELELYEFADFIRLADQSGLLRSGWPEWKQYRADRGRTVHTYGEAAALAISAHLQDFSTEIHVLLRNLKERTERDHD